MPLKDTRRGDQPAPFSEIDDALIQAALEVAERRLHYGDALTDPAAVRTYLKLWASGKQEEEFGCIWLTTDHRVIKPQVLFKGSIDSASVYPRVVVKAGLAHNASAVILFHNHPSGNAEPSPADRVLTTRLKEALSLVDIRLLDHMVAGREVVSLAELGWV